MENKNNPFKLLDSINLNDTTISSEMRVLRLLPYTSINQHFLLVDIINFNLDGKLYFKTDKEIATSIGCAVTSVDKVIKGLKKLNLINTITTDNYQWKTGKGGRRRYIWFNHNHIINSIINNDNFKSKEKSEDIINAVEEITQYNFNETFVNGIINTVSNKQKTFKTPTKTAVEAKKEVSQPAPESVAVNEVEAVKQPKPTATFEEIFPEEKDDKEHVTIKSIDRNKIKEAEELEKAEEMEALKFAEDTIDKMNNINEDEQCLLNIISNEDDQQLYFELDQLEDIIEQYDDQLTDNLKNTTIFINVVKQLINKNKIEKITGEDFSTYLILFGTKKEAENVAEYEEQTV